MAQRPVTDIHQIASEMYNKLTEQGEAEIDDVRRAFYDIMNISHDVNASYGVPDPTVQSSRRVTEPFKPIAQGRAEDPIAAINFKVDTGAGATNAPQIVQGDMPAVGQVDHLVAPTTEEVIVPAPARSDWTNATLREELGKHGFLEDPVRKNQVLDDGAYRTWFVRRGYEVILVESARSKPYLLNNLGQLIDVMQLAHRNVNMRQPGEGRQAR